LTKKKQKFKSSSNYINLKDKIEGKKNHCHVKKAKRHLC